MRRKREFQQPAWVGYFGGSCPVVQSLSFSGVHVALREGGNLAAKEANRRRLSLGVKIPPGTSSAVWVCCVNKAFLRLLEAGDSQ